MSTFMPYRKRRGPKPAAAALLEQTTTSVAELLRPLALAIDIVPRSGTVSFRDVDGKVWLVTIQASDVDSLAAEAAGALDEVYREHVVRYQSAAGGWVLWQTEPAPNVSSARSYVGSGRARTRDNAAAAARRFLDFWTLRKPASRASKTKKES